MRLARTIIGMVHLPPLPGSPRWDGSMSRVVACALADANAAIFADVGGKHAVPLGPVDLDQTARDLVHRGLADALVVSGPATGQATPLTDVKRVRSAVADVPLLIGSGVTAETIAELLSVADGVIVGTSVKRNGDVRLPVERARVEKLVAAAR